MVGKTALQRDLNDRPVRCDEQPRNADVGGYHIAFYVDDIDAAVAYLKRQNIKVCADSKLMENNPEGKNYEKDFSCKFWGPVRPDA